jgi:chromate transporter
MSVIGERMSEPNFQKMTRTFGRIGCLSFGGPAGQIALMHKELVDERGWISEERYFQALNFCHLLPGGLVGGGLLVLPGPLAMLAL